MVRGCRGPPQRTILQSPTFAVQIASGVTYAAQTQEPLANLGAFPRNVQPAEGTEEYAQSSTHAESRNGSLTCLPLCLCVAPKLNVLQRRYTH